MPGENFFGVLSSQKMSLLGFEIRPHWWDLNALTSSPVYLINIAIE